MMDISVALATYNGEKYLRLQLDSIIKQLENHDEIIICDDGSIDETKSIIRKIMFSDKRIKFFQNDHLGYVSNFESAIMKCSNDIILLSDQDDLWEDNKVEKIRNILSDDNCNAELILHNASCFKNKYNIEKKLINNMKHGFYTNIYKSCYWGCCMAFTRKFTKEFLPFPSNLTAHDQWIGLVGEYKRVSLFLNEPLIKHRIHSSNVSKKLSFVKKISFRLNIIYSFIKYIYSKKIKSLKL
jgi:glycosyltransferase involved in cell wall biosynthesis